MQRTIGSWWLSDHDALENETVSWEKGCNRTQSSGRAVGGKMFVTNKRVLFSPHHFDAALGGEKLSIPLEAIEEVSLESPGTSGIKDRLWGGGARTRLRLDLTDGSAELFVMNGVSNAAEYIKSVIGDE